MKMVVGLGNPGPQYELTRHNVGFLAVDRLIDRWGASGPVTKFQGETFQAKAVGESILLVKPQTFMNVSGKCVAPLATFYKLKPEDIVVIHDELDLPPMALRIKTGGGTGGHNGLKSLDASLGAGNTGYHRVRIGVGHKILPTGAKGSSADHVLDAFHDNELKALDPVLDRVAQAVEKILQGDVKGAMNEFNRKPEESGSD